MFSDDPTLLSVAVRIFFLRPMYFYTKYIVSVINNDMDIRVGNT